MPSITAYLLSPRMALPTPWLFSGSTWSLCSAFEHHAFPLDLAFKQSANPSYSNDMPIRCQPFSEFRPSPKNCVRILASLSSFVSLSPAA